MKKMAKYIDLEALKQFPIRKDHYDKENGNEHFIFGIEAVMEYAESLPAADVAPLVRCRDCAEDGRFTCPLAYIENNTLCFVDHSPDFFCAAGERKEGAE